jgi:hypothetical protein
LTITTSITILHHHPFPDSLPYHQPICGQGGKPSSKAKGHKGKGKQKTRGRSNWKSPERNAAAKKAIDNW